MPITKLIPIRDLNLDLRNFRTVKQQSEKRALHAMVAINPDWFWALMESLIDEGYHPTENILVLKSGSGGNGLTVKEGNRRVAALKLAHGDLRATNLAIPANVQEKIKSLSKKWKTDNASVPCAIYDATDSGVVDRIIALTHGKGEKASRDHWQAVARARHNRDMLNANEPALDLLESYLKNGQNITSEQGERWAGNYPLTVLDEAIKRLAPRVNEASSRELVEAYPKKTQFRKQLESILRDIGLGQLRFDGIRSSEDIFAAKYRIPSITPTSSSTTTSTSGGGNSTSGGSTNASASTTSTARKKPKAFALNDPRSVTRELGKFCPIGQDRGKVVTLQKEARTLKIGKHPHAFCFVLRSMFEISAKAYCKDHAKSGGPKASKPDGQDKNLADVLRDVTNHLTQNNTDKAKVKALHGAMAELGKKDGFLSVTSMNQLVHHPRFSVDAGTISTLFHNVFPLLEAMNA